MGFLLSTLAKSMLMDYETVRISLSHDDPSSAHP